MKKIINSIVLMLILCILFAPQAFADEPNEEPANIPAAEEEVYAAPEIEPNPDVVPNDEEEILVNIEDITQEPDGVEGNTAQVENKFTENTDPETEKYTVEFVNPSDGSEVIIPGGSDVVLSVINTELGLGLNLAEVENVESSNVMLFSVEKIVAEENLGCCYDYLIHSHQAFSSKEELWIYLINSGKVTIDVYDANKYTEIANEVWTGTGDAGNYVTVKYLDLDWYVIGFDGDGVAQGTSGSTGTMTLLLKDVIKDAGDTPISKQFNPSRSGSDCNYYKGSTLQKYLIDDWYKNNIKSHADSSAIVSRNLEVEEYRAEPYTDGVSGKKVDDQPVWCLSTKEAYALSKNNNNFTYTHASGNWWLRSPGGGFIFHAGYVTDVGVVIYYGGFVDDYDGVRPALWVNLDSVIIESNGTEKTVKLKTEPQTEQTAMVIVYVDGEILIYGRDYTVDNGKIILSADYLETLSSGVHVLTSNYGFKAEFSVNDDSNETIKYVWTSDMTEGLKF